jgi:glycosyltransferase involved in cell wall biosynthesis
MVSRVALFAARPALHLRIASPSRNVSLIPSLSVVSPLWNVQSMLTGAVEELLEILPELTDRFEVVLVDDASTEATLETARELALGYPQVQLLVQPVRLGGAESLRNALRFTHGEMLMYCAIRPGFDAYDVGKLWERMSDGGAVWAEFDGETWTRDFPVEYASAIDGGETMPDLLLLPRRLLAGWQVRRDSLDLLGHLRARGYAVEQLDTRVVRTPAGPPRPKSGVFARPSQGKSARNLIYSGPRQ